MFQYRCLFAISTLSLACMSSTFAAVPVDLSHQSVSVLHSFIAPSVVQSQVTLKETSSAIDFNKTKHIRFQQTVAGHAVWGSDAVAHIPQGVHASLTNLPAATTMNGNLYQNLLNDLPTAPIAEQGDKILTYAIQLHQKKSGVSVLDPSHVKKDLIVYVDKKNVAHWAYHIAFLSSSAEGQLVVPTYIIDANNFSVYEEWNDAQTDTVVNGGGYGGNPKMSKLSYDGSGAYPALTMMRNESTHTCLLQNKDVVVLDDNHKPVFFLDAEVAKFACDAPEAQHNNIFWNGDQDAVNEGYSPANDALYIGKIIKDMYQQLYGLDVLNSGSKPLKMNVHAKDWSGKIMENAMFLSLNNEMYFGDGLSRFYPLTSLGVGAHEISHGFTSQHSQLVYEKQSGGLNEAFSDMAAQEAEYYSSNPHVNSWQIGPEIVKGNGALRYMDDPTKDGRSIGNMKDYNDELNVHLTSGIFNKAFYLMGTAPGWNTQMAFDVMVQANMNYWTSTTTFEEAACGVVKATHDKHYDVSAVNRAMAGVGVDVSHC